MNCSPKYVSFLKKKLIDWFERKRKRERERERETPFVSPIHAFISWFSHVPWLATKLTTLGYQDAALSNWATRPGQIALFLPLLKLLKILPIIILSYLYILSSNYFKINYFIYTINYFANFSTIVREWLFFSGGKRWIGQLW